MWLLAVSCNLGFWVHFWMSFDMKFFSPPPTIFSRDKEVFWVDGVIINSFLEVVLKTSMAAKKFDYIQSFLALCTTIGGHNFLELRLYHSSSSQAVPRLFCELQVSWTLAALLEVELDPPHKLQQDKNKNKSYLCGGEREREELDTFWKQSFFFNVIVGLYIYSLVWMKSSPPTPPPHTPAQLFRVSECSKTAASSLEN